MEVVDPPSAEVQTSHTFPKDCFYHAFKYDFLHHGVFRVCLQDSVHEGVVEIPEEILEDCCSMCTVHSPKKLFSSFRDPIELVCRRTWWKRSMTKPQILMNLPRTPIAMISVIQISSYKRMGLQEVVPVEVVEQLDEEVQNSGEFPKDCYLDYIHINSTSILFIYACRIRFPSKWWNSPMKKSQIPMNFLSPRTVIVQLKLTWCNSPLYINNFWYVEFGCRKWKWWNRPNKFKRRTVST